MSQLKRTIRSPYLHAAAAIFFASCMNAMIKGLSAHESVIVVTAWRYSLGACLALVLWTIFRPKLPGWQAIPFHLLRGFFQIMSAGLFFWGVSVIPLATAAALGLTGTLMVGPLAWLMLKEPLKRDVIFGTLLGFGGALYIIHFEANLLRQSLKDHSLVTSRPYLRRYFTPCRSSYSGLDHKAKTPLWWRFLQIHCQPFTCFPSFS